MIETDMCRVGGGATASQYYQYDERGNVLLVTSASGEVEAGYEPDAYGNLAFAFAMDKNGTPLATRPDIFYTGKDFDPTTGLYYFNARWYDPETGRFLSRAEYSPDEEHAYLFVEGDPVNSIDPSGQLRVCCRSVKMPFGNRADHCYFEWGCPDNRQTMGLYGDGGGTIRRNYPDDQGNRCGPELGDANVPAILKSAARQGTGGYNYNKYKKNCNTFVERALIDAGIDPATAFPPTAVGRLPGVSFKLLREPRRI